MNSHREQAWTCCAMLLFLTILATAVAVVLLYPYEEEKDTNRRTENTRVVTSSHAVSSDDAFAERPVSAPAVNVSGVSPTYFHDKPLPTCYGTYSAMGDHHALNDALLQRVGRNFTRERTGEGDRISFPTDDAMDAFLESYGEILASHLKFNPDDLNRFMELRCHRAMVRVLQTGPTVIIIAARERGAPPATYSRGTELVLVPDPDPMDALVAHPAWRDVNFEAMRNRLRWSLRTERNHTYLADGAIVGDSTLRVRAIAPMPTYYVISDRYGYGFCIPMSRRYVRDDNAANGFGTAAYPHYGYYQLTRDGVYLDGGAVFHNFVPGRPSTREIRLATQAAEAATQAAAANRSACRVVADPLDAARARIAGSRVVEGEVVAPARKYSFMVSLQVAYDVKARSMAAHVCGGALIAPRWLLTSAHCVDGVHVNWPSKVNCFVHIHHADIGRQTLSKDDEGCVESVAIASVRLHPLYNSTTFAYDIALVELVAASSYRPIEIYDPARHGSGLDVTGATVHVAGWGHTTYNGDVSDELLVMRTRIYDREMCAYNYAHIKDEAGVEHTMLNAVFDDYNFCAYRRDGDTIVDNCQGDSGGALFHEDARTGRVMVIGLVSWGFRCAYAHSVVPGVYSNVTHALPWIREYLPHA
ncbi:hypothetical protein CYMTET_43351 [Cymbomonas tetramitiformis]|uniref:Peptidase S1 domain-containing protein n=1 Tax=Cymbomonas tetramitiformis TaxID=36881 RepID=A0AAE0C479_9CHLO|nr:hypothetical protein CYMTET_43351 [Cymbomonas tetramitiformis]